MRIRVAVPEDHVQPPVIDAALEAVTRLNESMLQNGDIPPFDPDDPGVQWRPENFGDEHFDNAQTVLQRGWGDCDDLAPWRAASLRQSGEDPGAYARVVTSGPNTYHAIVQRSDGQIDDPSVAAGMRPLTGPSTQTQSSVVGGQVAETIDVWACDPHDGRMYQGSLLPTTSPLLPHCGPAFSMQALYADKESGEPAQYAGQGMWTSPSGQIHESLTPAELAVSGRRIAVVGCVGRCDVPIVGMRTVRVRSYVRRAPHHGRRSRVHGCCGYALSHTAGGYGHGPGAALAGAVMGAAATAAASGMTGTPADRYKLLALQGLLAGLPQHQVTELLATHMLADAQAGTAPAPTPAAALAATHPAAQHAVPHAAQAHPATAPHPSGPHAPSGPKAPPPKKTHGWVRDADAVIGYHAAAAIVGDSGAQGILDFISQAAGVVQPLASGLSSLPGVGPLLATGAQQMMGVAQGALKGNVADIAAAALGPLGMGAMGMFQGGGGSPAAGAAPGTTPAAVQHVLTPQQQAYVLAHGRPTGPTGRVPGYVPPSAAPGGAAAPSGILAQLAQNPLASSLMAQAESSGQPVDLSSLFN
jgi:hypothetical protein